jgi:TrwC relaxase
VMTIHKITAGDGYTYLTRQVAAGDSSPERGKSAARYYTETGNPPGTWMGSGIDSLGLSGQVSEEQMTALGRVWSCDRFGFGSLDSAGLVEP